MSGYLLDTNCVSEAVRQEPEPRVAQWMQRIDENLLYLSVLTLGEVRKGIALLPQGRRRKQLESWLDVDLRARFAERLLPVDASVAERWGVLAANARKKGRALPIIDGLLAATAIQHDLLVVSRNEEDFVAIEVGVVNPWKA